MIAPLTLLVVGVLVCIVGILATAATYKSAGSTHGYFAVIAFLGAGAAVIGIIWLVINLVIGG